MGHSRRTEDNQSVSPLTLLRILARRRAGETLVALHQKFGVSKSTIGRWSVRWGREAAAFNQSCLDLQNAIVSLHKDTMALADASEQLHLTLIEMARSEDEASNGRVQELLGKTMRLEDTIRTLENGILEHYGLASEFAASMKRG